MAGVGKRTYLREVNPYLICPLCRGYLIDATTVVECLHSFCRSCILKHLSTEAHCPSCKHVLNKAKPNIKADKALQDIVYKLVPGLYHKEMRKRREFYKKHPEHADFATPEQRGEDVSGRLIFAPEDAVSLSLEYLPPGADPLTILLSTNDETNHSNTSNGHNNNNLNNNNHNGNSTSNRRYLQCPALVTIAHLKKFLALKYSVDMTRYTIEICHRRAPLPEHWTLMDVAYIYAWKRNAPMRFFYRVALEEQRLEAPPHERPSTPGVGASLPPLDVSDATRNNGTVDTSNNNTESGSETDPLGTSECAEISKLEESNEVPREKSRSPIEEKREIEEKQVYASDVSVTETSTTATVMTSNTSAATATSTSTTTTTVSNSSPTTVTTTESTKQVKTPIKILKNPDGRYEVLRNPPLSWNAKEPSTTSADTKSTNPEFSVVSIGNGQNSNGVKITLKQCSPTNSNTKKPKVISDVLLHSSQIERNSQGALVLQQIQREREKQQAEKQEKQKRRVTFMDTTSPEKPINTVAKPNLKKPGEQQEKKQFLQGFHLTARESGSESTVSESIAKTVTETSSSGEVNDIKPKNNVSPKKEQDSVKPEITISAEVTKKKNDAENTSANVSGVTANANKRVGVPSGISNNARQNINKQCSDIDTRTFSYAKSPSANLNISASNNASKMDVYTFSNDPPVVPAGAVKRKCPPGLPIFDVKRKRQQQVQPQAVKKQTSAPQNNPKSPRKPTVEHVVPNKRPATTMAEPGTSRAPPATNTKPSANPMLSNDTRNILDGCGLNIPASLSITLTAPKHPGNSGGFVEPSDPKDNRKGTLGKVSPSITLNDRSVDPRVLKALKAGQIRMPAPPKPRQTKQPDREMPQPRQTASAKRKREQESREILDLSGGKKMDIHPLRIPQPVSKLKAKPPTRDILPNISDQGQVVTIMGGHRYYRAPPGSLTPAAHRVSDCPLPTPGRTPVYASGLSNSLGGNRPTTNLSSVFPSLQSLYALSQAPNLQQFQMDARLRVPRTMESNSTTIPSSDNRSLGGSIPGKTHLAAQCAPVKPARSSVASLAVPIAKQSSNDRPSPASVNRLPLNETNKPPLFRNNENLHALDIGQQLSVQTKYSPVMESKNRYSPRSSTGNTSSSEEQMCTMEVSRESNAEQNNQSKKDSDNTSRQLQHHHREAASPRVSSTASPSPPPGDNTINSNNGENSGGHSDNSVSNASNTSENDSPANSAKSNMGSEVSSSKSPASPDSSSVTIENHSMKNCSSVEQGLVACS